MMKQKQADTVIIAIMAVLIIAGLWLGLTYKALEQSIERVEILEADLEQANADRLRYRALYLECVADKIPSREGTR